VVKASVATAIFLLISAASLVKSVLLIPVGCWNEPGAVIYFGYNSKIMKAGCFIGKIELLSIITPKV